MTFARRFADKHSLHRLLCIAAITLAACGVDQAPSQVAATPAQTSPRSQGMRRFVETPLPVEIFPAAGEQAKLLAVDGTDNDHLAGSIALWADTVVAGATTDDVNGTVSGSAYVFIRSGGVWSQEQKLLPSDGAAFDYFGEDVAVSGDTVIIGASQNDDQGATSGSAYVFVRSGGAWTEQQKLLPTGGMAGDEFGLSVAVEADTAIVGTTSSENGQDSGSAVAFVRNAGVWTEQQKLIPSDSMAGDNFGNSVAISGNTVVVGAWQDDEIGSDSGSAYVFVRNGGVWMQQAKLLPSDGAMGDWFGWAVAVSGDTAIVSATEDDDKGSTSGSVYVFVRSGGVWTQQQKLVASDGATFDHLGRSLAVSADTFIAGAPYAGPYGRAYLFSRTGGVWTEQQKLVGSDSATTDFFGSSAGAWGDTMVVGATGHDDKAVDSGAAYVFIAIQGGNPCVMNTECMSGFCVDGVCCNTACGGGATNDCQACSIAAGNLTDGVCAPLPASVECRPSAGECDSAESCDSVSLACPADMSAPDGTICTSGTCAGGVCVSGGAGGGGGSAGNAGSGGSAGNAGSGGSGGAAAGSGGNASSSSGAGNAGSGGNAGSAGSPGQTGEEGGCGCRTVGHPSSRTWLGAVSVIGLIMASMRRRRHVLSRNLPGRV